MESTTKSTVLKVFRIAVFSNISYHSIEYIRIVYKSKKWKFLEIFSANTSCQPSDKEHIKCSV